LKGERGIVRQLKFAIVGVLNTTVDFVVFNLLAGVLSLPILAASLIAYSCGIVTSFVFNRNWTFADRLTDSGRALIIRFVVTNLLGLSINTLIVTTAASLLTELTDMSQGWLLAVSKILATGGTLVVNFTLMHRWVFISGR
jgi:putative flippase GtrA